MIVKKIGSALSVYLNKFHETGVNVGIWFIVGSGIMKTIFTKNLSDRHLNTNLNSIIGIINLSKIFCFFVGLASFVVVTVQLSRIWVSPSYFFIENPSSHINFGVFLQLLQCRFQNPLKQLRWRFSRCS